MLRTLMLVSVLGCVWVSNAAACRGPEFNSTIFFDEFPKGINADVVAEITVTELIDRSKFDRNSMHRYRGYYVGIARVEQVLKGAIDGESVRIVAPASDCDIKVLPGAHGIVAGNIQVNATGEKELFVISESGYQRQIRKSSSK